MEYFNKQLDIKLFDTADTGSEKKTFLEGVNILILILLGCGGLYIYSSTFLSQDPSPKLSGITANAVESSNSDKKVKENNNPAVGQNNKLTLKGHQVVGEKLTFTLDNFDKKAIYYIDFGDGTKKTMSNQETQHVYSKTGSFNVEVKVNYEGKALQRISSQVIISSPKDVNQGVKVVK